jgi:hypothetical protein
MVALRGKSQHKLQHEFLVELRRLLNMDLSNHTSASFENERILNQSHVAYNGVSMQGVTKTKRMKSTKPFLLLYFNATT